MVTPSSIYLHNSTLCRSQLTTSGRNSQRGIRKQWRGALGSVNDFSIEPKMELSLSLDIPFITASSGSPIIHGGTLLAPRWSLHSNKGVAPQRLNLWTGKQTLKFPLESGSKRGLCLVYYRRCYLNCYAYLGTLCTRPGCKAFHMATLVVFIQS